MAVAGTRMLMRDMSSMVCIDVAPETAGMPDA
jgi:hypothetical protein